METDGAKAVMGALMADGGDARFVGGCVRDAVIKRPVSDVDIATPLKPDKFCDASAPMASRPSKRVSNTVPSPRWPTASHTKSRRFARM